MWWFVRKGQPEKQARLVSENIWAEEQLLASLPDMGQLAQHDVAVKVWLPEVVAQTLKWVADHEGVSQSSWVREHLMGYVYGQAALLAYRIRAKRAGNGDIRFSRSGGKQALGRWIYKVPQLGKNAVAFKVWMGEQMQSDLSALATHAGVGLSPFLREVLVGELFGRGSLPERPEIVGQPSDEALAWETGDAVKTAVVEEADFQDLGFAEREWANSETSPDTN
jgi:hypothetical protein